MADALRLSVSHGESKPRVAIVGGGYLGSRIAAELGLANCDVMIYDRGAGPNVKQGVERALCELEQCTRPFLPTPRDPRSFTPPRVFSPTRSLRNR